MKAFKIITLLSLFLLTTGCDSGRITQDVRYVQKLDCYEIKTYVWMNGPSNVFEEIVYYDFSCVTLESVDIAKDYEFKKAEKIRNNLKRFN